MPPAPAFIECKMVCGWGAQVLKDINAADIPRITVWNKIDLVGDPDMVHLVAAGREAVVCCSAATGEGIDGLLHAFERHLCKGMVLRRALIPFSQARRTDVHLHPHPPSDVCLSVAVGKFHASIPTGSRVAH